MRADKEVGKNEKSRETFWGSMRLLGTGARN